MLVITAVYVVALALFCAGFYFAHPVKTLQMVVLSARTAYSTMTDHSLDDLTKEKTIQRCAIDMVKQAVALFIKLAVILLVATFPVWLASMFDLVTMESFGSFIMRVDVILVTTAVLLVLVVAYKQIVKA